MEKKTFNNLIGYKLEDINEKEMIVSKDNKRYILEFEEDYGDCCGYNELKTNLFIDSNNQPIITNIEYKPYQDNYGEANGLIITFYGENKKLAEIDSYSSSGSGWCYGACVSVKCKELDINEIITEW